MTTEIGYVKLILGTIDESLVVKSYGDTSNLKKNGSSKYAMITDSEIFGFKDNLTRKSYMYSITLRSESETVLETLIDTLITNVDKINTFVSIDGYTRPSTLCFIKFYPYGKKYKDNNNKKIS